MMVPMTCNTGTDRLKHLTVADFNEQLTQVHYPEWLLQLHLIETGLKETAELDIMAEIKQAFHSMLEKEKVHVFPALLLLEQQGKTTDCKLFKLASVHYSFALSAMQQLKHRSCTESNTSYIPGQIKEMEKALIELQKAKEQYLFNRFKSCEGSCRKI